MPVVFVHGVNVRRDADYDKSVTNRDDLFRGLGLTGLVPDPATTFIANPYWGDHAAHFHWDKQFLPEGATEAFGSSDERRVALLAETAADVAAEKPPDGNFLVALSRKSFLRAVDCLCAFTALAPDDMPDDVEGFAEFCRAALAYAEANPKPEWLASVADDDQFAERLLGNIPQSAPADTEQFGGKEVWNWVKGAAGKVGQAAANVGTAAAGTVGSAASQVGAAAARAGGAAATAALNSSAAGVVLNPLAERAPRYFYSRFGLFLGDAFKYIQKRGTAGNEGAIVKEVADAFRKADAVRKQGDPLVVVGHSMGGNICYDILTHFLPKLECDVFVTVGSQVAMFEELKLFHASDDTIPGPGRDKVTVPENIKKWVNVFDPKDVFAYRTEPVFDRAKDYTFDTETTAVGAHGMYFFRPRFHQRFNARLLEALA